MKLKVFYILLLLATTFSCRKDDVGVINLFKQPKHFPAPYYQFNNFNLTQERIDLGKRLFYEPLLSLDNSISCASCHFKSHGFSDPGNAFSKGVFDSLSARNSISLANLAWNKSFFWDGGVNHLELSSFAPISNINEMRENINQVANKLSEKYLYNSMFELAYDTDSITAERILWSLAAYMATLISAESEYDKVYSGNSTFNSEQEKGYQLFKKDCATCHTEPLTTNYNFENNGLDSVFSDNGRELITLNPTDKGKFKVPSLRNIALSPPYMHDGRFETLNEVIEHYSSGIKESSTLSDLPINGFNYTLQEKASLISFLESLTDYSYINNPNH
jgi:cytochrome c peroxidase